MFVIQLRRWYSCKMQDVFSEQHPLSSDPRFEWKKDFQDGKRRQTCEKMWETWGRATEEGSLFQDGQIWNITRTENHSFKISLTVWIQEGDWAGWSIAKQCHKASSPPRWPGSLQPHKIMPAVRNTTTPATFEGSISKKNLLLVSHWPLQVTWHQVGQWAATHNNQVMSVRWFQEVACLVIF